MSNFPNRSEGSPVFSVGRDPNKMAAAGRAMVLLMRDDAFSGLAIGEIGRLIAGQVNRDHYFFVGRNGKITGYLGWALCSHVAAERWAHQNDGSLVGDGTTGDCVIINCWLADGRDMNSFLISKLRDEFASLKKLYARRRYLDGTHRALVLDIDRTRKTGRAKFATTV